MQKNYTIRVENQAPESDYNYFFNSFINYNTNIIGEQPDHPLKTMITNSNGEIIAGFLGDVMWDSGFVYYFWVDEAVQSDLMEKLLILLENQVVENGVDKVRIENVYGQYFNFFQKHYNILAAYEDRPIGSTCYFFIEENITTTKSVDLESYTVYYNDQITKEMDKEFIDKMKASHSPIFDTPAKPLKVFARNEENQIVGGASCFVSRDWLYVNILWVDDNYRGEGLGSEIMTFAENRAQEMGVDKVYLETAEFQAKGFYEKLGYQAISTIKDLPKGYNYYFMKKYMR